MLEAQAAYERAGLDFGKHAVAVTGDGSELDQATPSRSGFARALPDVGLGRRPHQRALRRRPPARGAAGHRHRRHARRRRATATRSRACTTRARTRPRCWRSCGTGPAAARGKKDMVVLPYKDRLVLFSRYLQQLVMESLGKEQDLDGKVVHQGIAVYGNKGSTDQHAYVQQLREGVQQLLRHLHRGAAAIATASRWRSRSSRRHARATTSPASSSARARRSTRTTASRSRSPSTRVDARNVGILIALYERAVGLYASLVEHQRLPPARRRGGQEGGRRRCWRCSRRSSARSPRPRAASSPSTRWRRRSARADDVEHVYKILEHAAANPDHGVSRTDGATPFSATYGEEHDGRREAEDRAHRAGRDGREPRAQHRGEGLSRSRSTTARPRRSTSSSRSNAGKKLKGAKSPKELVAALERPRRIIMMVKAGKPVDETIAALKPFLEKDDMLVDGGNEFFENTERRAKELEADGLHYVGMGVSGGEEGARHGPSMMPGGAPRRLRRAGADPDEDRGAGRRRAVRRLHGAGRRRALRQDGAQRHRVRRHAAHRRGVRSVAQRRRPVERTSSPTCSRSGTRASCSRSSSRSRRKILAKKDDLTGQPMVDVILDADGHEGHRQVDGAAGGRAGGAGADDRLVARGARRVGAEGGARRRVEDPAGAAAGAVVASTRSSSSTTCATRSTRRRSARYAQGMNLLRVASARRTSGTSSSARIARIWKGGCIIRAQFLGRIKEAYDRNADLPNLLLDARVPREMSRSAGRAGGGRSRSRCSTGCRCRR